MDKQDTLTPSQLITKQIAELADWRGNQLARLRKLILEAAPGLTEEWKWDTAVWSQKGNVVAAAAASLALRPQCACRSSTETIQAGTAR
jgi:hypothetical protein